MNTKETDKEYKEILKILKKVNAEPIDRNTIYNWNFKEDKITLWVDGIIIIKR